MTKMSKILWEGHALSTDPHLPPRLCGLDFEPLHYKFLATPLLRMLYSCTHIMATAGVKGLSQFH